MRDACMSLRGAALLALHAWKYRRTNCALCVQIQHERLNNLALFKALSQASTHDDPVCPDLRYLLVPLVVMIGMDRSGQLVPDNAGQSGEGQSTRKGRKQRKSRAVPTSVHNKRRDDQPVLVNLNSLRRFLKKRRKFLVEEVCLLCHVCAVA